MHATTLIAKEAVAEGTMAFHFKKPDGFSFGAGQSIDLTLKGSPEVVGPPHAFSLASGPGEGDLMIATRMRDSLFKRALGSLPLGGEVAIDGPFGSFMLHEKVARPAVFLSGGIGITPFLSMIKDASARHLPHKIILFYSNRRPQDVAFSRELAALAGENSNFALVNTMTALRASESWEGERGYIDAAMLGRHVPQGTDPIYYLAGPPQMIAAMRQMLTTSGVSADDIRFEEFAGY